MTRYVCALVLLVATALAEAAPAISKDLDVFYGDNPARPDKVLQTLDVYHEKRSPDSQKKRPVIVYLHGGSWAFGDKSDINHKADFFVPAGFVFISANYRLRWDYDLFDQLQDVVSVVVWIKKNAKKYGIDPDNIVLMGHGSGAHLAALVGTDGRYLKGEGMSLKDIQAVVAIDSVSYDIPRVLRELGSFIERRQHRLVFGENAQVQLEASPIHHVKAGKHIPSFALLYIPEGEASALQAEGFAKALREAEVNAILIPGNSKTPQSIDVELGQPGDIPTGALMAFLRATT